MKLLLPLAQGDAYGAAFEYSPGQFVLDYNDLTAYRQHPTHAIERGYYTDDTQMSIANALALLSGKPLTRELFASFYVQCFKRDERVGYAGRFYDFLVGVADGTQFLDQIKPFSDKSGAAMRAPVLGILPTVQEVIEVTTVQAKITHDTVDGINAAVAAALITHYFLYNHGNKAGLSQWLESHVQGDWSTPWSGKVGDKGWMSVKAAISAINANATMSGVLKQCIAYTGDVDTVAAVALAAAAQCPEISQDLPAFLFDDLENGDFGRDYIVDLDAQLTRKQAALAASVTG